jgi:hypothetical protein
VSFVCSSTKSIGYAVSPLVKVKITTGFLEDDSKISDGISTADADCHGRHQAVYDSNAHSSICTRTLLVGCDLV